MIIVPGVPLENGKWDRTMKARVYWSKYLFDRGIAKNIMYSGSAVYTPYYEGIIMSLYAEAIGIPKEHIFTETRAEHSTENIYYGYYKSKQLGFKKIALATDPFQAKQLNSFAKLRLGNSVGVIPIVFDTLRAMEPMMTDPVINYQLAFEPNFISIVKRESRWKRIKGTLSWNKDKDAYNRRKK
ncbi:MAG: YdcF family protein [Ferruginibacter sp.]